ncbi:disease resistance protein [Quercus suber]|uniref:Disease resistance protein n=1 Tax=Quercus suber TaxID=58331 RepID=A0AAW0M1N7_QUESU
MDTLLDRSKEVKDDKKVIEKEGNKIRGQVIKWNDNVKKLQPRVNQILEKMVNNNKNSSQCFLDCNKRYRKSKEVEEILQEIKRLLEARCFNSGMIYPIRVPRVVEHIPGPSIQGGIGKTILVKNLNNELKTTSMKPFSIVIWATVSKNFDIKNVQIQITERLNMEVKMEESVQRTASQLYQRLEKQEKFLLILDDVWEKIYLYTLGVPRPEDHKEAWQLFSQNARNVTHLEEIRPFAEAIVRECCRLAVAIITVVAAMRKKTKVKLWKQDFSIQISELVQYWLAEGLIDGLNYEDSIEGIVVIEKLKDSCLWEDGAHERTVKMHDIVRDVARWIASSSKDGCSCRNLEEISSLGMLSNLQKLDLSASFAGLKSLIFSRCPINLGQGGGCAAPGDLLPNLEELRLYNMLDLKSISELAGHLG